MREKIDGVDIEMLKNDSLSLPNIHAFYEHFHGIFSLTTGRIIKGDIPSEKEECIETWIVLNDQKLIADWKSINREQFHNFLKNDKSIQKTICEFYEIKIGMGQHTYYEISYIHASFKQKEALFSVVTGEMMDVVNGEFDDFPYKPRCLVTGWLTIHKDALLQYWEELKINPHCSPKNIRPLK